MLRTLDEEGFQEFMRHGKLSESTVKAYVIAVKKLESYLKKYRGGKGLEKANTQDIKDFALWGGRQLKSIDVYLHGIQKYYEYLPNKELCNAIRGIPRYKPPKSRSRIDLIEWRDFQERMEKAEKKGIRDQDRALLNVLWSRMDRNEILQLKISDIDFEKYYIASRMGGRKFYLTEKAWNALEKYVPIAERGKGKRLFSIGKRNFQRITKIYFEELGQTPTKLRLSCEKDLIEAGERTRFRVLPERVQKPKTRVEVSKEKIGELIFPRKVFNRLPLKVGETIEGVVLNYMNDLPDFCFWGMRKALIDAICIRFRKDKKGKMLYDKDMNPYPLSTLIELTKQEGYISVYQVRNLKRQVKVFGDTASHDYMTDLHKEEIPSIFKHLRLALARMYKENDISESK